MCNGFKFLPDPIWLENEYKYKRLNNDMKRLPTLRLRMRVSI